MADDKDCFVDFIADATGAPDVGPEFTHEKIIEAVSSTISDGFTTVFPTEACFVEQCIKRIAIMSQCKNRGACPAQTRTAPWKMAGFGVAWGGKRGRKSL